MKYNDTQAVINEPQAQPLLLPTLAMLGTVVFWGMSFISAKVVLNTGVPPMTLAFLRFLCASLILFPILKIREPDTRLDRGNLKTIVISSILGITAYFYFEVTGLNLTDASIASMIMATIPIFTVILEIIYYKNDVSRVKVIGASLSVVGVVILIGFSFGTQNNPLAFLGNMLILGSCICWVGYIMASKSLKGHYSGLALTTFQTLFGTLFLLPLTLLEYKKWVPITPLASVNIIYLGIFCSALCYFLYLYSLEKLGPLAVSTYINLIPIVGVLGGIIILGETISTLQIMGGSIILLGVLLVNRS